MEPLYITAYTAVNALGRGTQAMLDAIRDERSGLQPLNFPPAQLATYVGQVEGLD